MKLNTNLNPKPRPAPFKKNDPIDMGQIIKHQRDKLELTQSEYGDLVGVSSASVNRWEKNTQKIEEKYIKRIDDVDIVVRALPSGDIDPEFRHALLTNYNLEQVILVCFACGLIHEIPERVDHRGFFISIFKGEKIGCVRKAPIYRLLDTPDNSARGQLIDLLKSNPEEKNQKNYAKESPLVYAVRQGKYESAIILIEHGANLKETDEHGNGILSEMFSIKYRENDPQKDIIIEMIKTAISGGANVNAVDCYNRTPLYFAAINNYPGLIVSLLIKSLANVDVVTTAEMYSRTPLMEAIYNKNFEVATLLVDNGANVNLCDNEGYSAVHYAVYAKAVQLFRLMLSKNGDANKKSNDGKTPLDLAQEQGYEEFPEIFNEHIKSTGAGDQK